MQYDPPPDPSRSRKRSSAWIADDDINEYESQLTNIEDTPSKRLLSNRGEAIPTKPLIRYNGQKLLNHLAFTRIYVTANFQNYNPNQSFVVLCMVSEQDDLYQALWYLSLPTHLPLSMSSLIQCSHILPTLYNTAPTLQALAVTGGYVSPNSTPHQSLLRMLPLVTTAGMEVTVAEEFEAFRREVGGCDSCVAVVDYRGVCVWSSVEALEPHLTGVGRVQALERALSGVIGVDGPGDVAMGDV